MTSSPPSLNKQSHDVANSLYTEVPQIISIINKSLFCRDLVHRQTAMYTIQHLSLGVAGFGCEDALNHLLNYVWPNVFETSPHVVQAFMGSIEGMRLGLGPTRVMQYALQVSEVLVC